MDGKRVRFACTPEVDVLREEVDGITRKLGKVAKQAVEVEGVIATVQSLSAKVGRMETSLQHMQDDVKLLSPPVPSSRQLDIDDMDFENACDNDDDDDDDSFLHTFRQSLRPGVPVHLDGLASRPELNGVAGMLGEHHADKCRWQVHCGTTVLLLRVQNIYP